MKYKGAAKRNFEICNKTKVSVDRLSYIASINDKLMKMRLNNHGKVGRCRNEKKENLELLTVGWVELMVQ